MRFLLIYPKMGYGGWSFFTGINLYHCEIVSGISIGILGFGFVFEVFHETQ